MSLEFKYYKIDDIGEVVSGGTPSTSKNEYWYGDIGWITPKDLSSYDDIYISRGERNISSEGLNNSSAKLVPKNTVLMTSRAPIGYIAIANNELSTNQGFKSLICDEKICHYKYFYYWLKLNIKYIINNSNGSTFKEISGGTFKNLEISLPSISEQKAISSVLWTIDEKISVLKKINRNLLQLSKVTFKNWFVDFEPFGGVQPNDWKICTLEDVCDLNAGGDKPEVVSDQITDSCIYPIYSNGLDNDGLYGYTNHAKIFDECVTVSARGTIGFVCLRHTPYVPIVRLVSVIPKKEFISAKYLYLFLDRLNIIGTGTTQQQLTIPDFKKTEIFVPTLDIVESFTNHLNPIFDKIWIQEEEIKKLSKLRDTLLPKLMSGEIDVSKINCDLE
uniref:restriction endonuclease subunit S n=1 Tax=Methanobrevibacter sp. TaxID=66852 RepID=UPI00386D7FDF